MHFVKEKITHEEVINKSRFITYLIPVKTIEDVNNELNTIKRLHYNATHHCYGYILDNQSIQKSNDDGEPAGTAGMPILQVLLKNELSDVLCIVVRYFGGIHLGKGGLIRAYSGGASEAIKKASLYKEALRTMYAITIDYSLYDQVNYYLNEHAYVDETQFSDKVYITFYLYNDEIQTFLDTFHHQFEAITLSEVIIKLPLQS